MVKSFNIQLSCEIKPHCVVLCRRWRVRICIGEKIIYFWQKLNYCCYKVIHTACLQFILHVKIPNLSHKPILRFCTLGGQYHGTSTSSAQLWLVFDENYILHQELKPSNIYVYTHIPVYPLCWTTIQHNSDYVATRIFFSKTYQYGRNNTRPQNGIPCFMKLNVLQKMQCLTKLTVFVLRNSIG